MNARVVVIPAVVVLAGGAIALLARDPAKPPSTGPTPPPAQVQDTGIPKGEWHPQNLRFHLGPKTERVPCKVRAPEPISVFPPVRATPVESVPVLEGQAVRKGDLLVTFSAAQWQRALAVAEKSGDAAAAAEARRGLANLEVRAPGDGIVYSLGARRGERPLETRGAPLPIVVLFDWRKLTYEATAPAALAEILARNPQVFVGSGKEFLVEGEIAVNGPAAADGSIPLVLRPKAAPRSLPEPGGAAEIHVVVGTEELPVVPATAIRKEGGRSVVYIVTITADLVRRPVVVGTPLGDGFVSVSGVAKGESVAVWE